MTQKNLLSARDRLLEKLQQYFNDRSIDLDTPWCSLKCDMLDMAMIEDMTCEAYISGIYEIELPTILAGTIGDFVATYEKELLKHIDEKPFCDSNKMIFCCYPGGAGGFALRWILLQSPESTGPVRYSSGITSKGAAHNMCTRFGLYWHTAQAEVDDQSISEIAMRIDPYFEHRTFFLPHIPIQLIRCLRMHFNNATDHTGTPVDKWQEWGVTVLSDHIPPRAARLIFPNAKIISLYMPIRDRFRNFYEKNIMQPEHPDGDELKMMSLLRAAKLDDTLHSRRLIVQHEWEWAKILDGMHTDPILSDGAYVVDAARLFSVHTWKDEYQRLISNCGLTANLTAVEQFILEYASKQFSR